MTLQREAIYRVYSMLHTKDPAAQQMNEWYNGTKDPRRSSGPRR
jgi:hypothetical protein